MPSEVVDILIKAIDDIKESLTSIDGRLRTLENEVSAIKAGKTGWQNLKDVCLVVFGLAAVVLAILRLTHN